MLGPEREELIKDVIAYATLHPHHHELEGPVSAWTAEQKAAWNLLHPEQQIVGGKISDASSAVPASHVQQSATLRTDASGTWEEVQDDANHWILEHKDKQGRPLHAFTTREIEGFSDYEMASWQALHPGYVEGRATPTLPKVSTEQPNTPKPHRLVHTHALDSGAGGRRDRQDAGP